MKMSVADAAAALNVSSKTIYRWLGEGKIPGYRVHKQFRFDRAELLEWAAAQRLSVPNHVERLADRGELAVPRFDEALEFGGIHYRVGGSTRDEVLRDAVQALRIVDEGERDGLVQALIAREDLAPTAVGDGFALPHLRNPLRFEIRKPVVGLCYLEQPVDWRSPDGLPVHTLFIVVGPTVRSVLRLHIEAVFALRDPAFRGAVSGHAPRDAVLARAGAVAAALQRSGGS